MRRIVTALLLSGGLLLSVQGITCAMDAEKEKDIRRLIKITKTEDLAKQVTSQLMELIMASQKDSRPELSDEELLVIKEFLDDMKEEFDNADFAAIYLPIYDKYLSQEEIQGLIAFYESPVGRRLIEITPGLMSDCMTAGAQWGSEIEKKIVSEYKRKIESMRKKSKGKKKSTDGSDL